MHSGGHEDRPRRLALAFAHLQGEERAAELQLDPLPVELEELLDAGKRELDPADFEDLALDDPAILEPVRWPVTR